MLEFIIGILYITGPDLPHELTNLKMVQSPNGVIIIGGAKKSNISSDFLELTQSSSSWTILEQPKLRVPRFNFIAIPIPHHLANCT